MPIKAERFAMAQFADNNIIRSPRINEIFSPLL